MERWKNDKQRTIRSLMLGSKSEFTDVNFRFRAFFIAKSNV
ncbi:MAG: hypothetical protein K0S41_2257 [Anaerocolumna sp.]|jgi:hypothetical protein|nr:hypothetical protein [Anaerocolumna sp.]